MAEVRFQLPVSEKDASGALQKPHPLLAVCHGRSIAANPERSVVELIIPSTSKRNWRGKTDLALGRENR
jgi:hypothetical protein